MLTEVSVSMMACVSSISEMKFCLVTVAVFRNVAPRAHNIVNLSK